VLPPSSIPAASEEPCPIKTTLLVMPSNLIPQWRDEVAKHTAAGAARVLGEGGVLGVWGVLQVRLGGGEMSGASEAAGVGSLGVERLLGSGVWEGAPIPTPNPNPNPNPTPNPNPNPNPPNYKKAP